MVALNRWERAPAAAAVDLLLCTRNMDSCEGCKALGRSQESDLRPDPGNRVALWFPFWTFGNLVFILFLFSFSAHAQLLQFLKPAYDEELGFAARSFRGTSLFKLFWMGSVGLSGTRLYSGECERLA